MGLEVFNYECEGQLNINDICKHEDLNNPMCVNCFNGFPIIGKCPADEGEENANRDGRL